MNKANAYMESVVLKVPATYLDSHLRKVSEENRETTKNHVEPVSSVQGTAPEHHLKRVEKHHQILRDNPVGAVGAYPTKNIVA